MGLKLTRWLQEARVPYMVLHPLCNECARNPGVVADDSSVLRPTVGGVARHPVLFGDAPAGLATTA
eukprot:13753355-Heterocapsa_arctica.AAC.1